MSVAPLETKTYCFGNQNMELPKRYTADRLVGHGAYGVVCSAVDTVTGSTVAIKKIGRVFEDLIDGKRILRELKVLSFLMHPNVLYLKDVFVHPQDPERFTDVYVVTEFMDTDLQYILRWKEIHLLEEHIQYFIFQLCSGLHYMHSAGILHRDLKPGNILTNSECELKICDFGLARGRGPHMTDYVITRWYRPPELLLVCDGYTCAVDLWAVGCLTVEMVTRKPLFAGKDYIHQINLIVDMLGVPLEEDLTGVKSPEALRYVRSLTPRPRPSWSRVLPNVSADLIDFVSKVLVYNTTKRLTALEALKHPWLSQYSEGEAPLEADVEFSWDEEEKEIGEADLRRLFWNEITTFCNSGKLR